MQKPNKPRVKKILAIVLLCILGIAAIVSYFLKLQILRLIALILFLIAATILARYDHPEAKISSLIVIVTCTAIFTFAPMLINLETESVTPSLLQTDVPVSPPTDTPVSFPTDTPVPFQVNTPIPITGINNSDTQLFMTIYPAEKIDWNTGIIDELWPIGSDYYVYDIKTKLFWTAHRVPGKDHVEAEPLTDRDTARLLKCYELDPTNNSFIQYRPILVTIGERTFACSLYAFPHSSPQSDTITNNGYNGSVCIHFTNSKTHGSNKVDLTHQETIEYAWLNAPNGHK